MWAAVTDSGPEEPGCSVPTTTPSHGPLLRGDSEQAKARGRARELRETPLSLARLRGASAPALQGPGTGGRMERELPKTQKKLRLELECRDNSPASRKLAGFGKLGSPAMKHQETLSVFRS